LENKFIRVIHPKTYSNWIRIRIENQLPTVPMPEFSLRPTRIPTILLSCSAITVIQPPPLVLKRELGNQKLQLVVFAEKFPFLQFVCRAIERNGHYYVRLRCSNFGYLVEGRYRTATLTITVLQPIEGIAFMAKTYIQLQQSEGFMIQAATQIFAAHIVAGTMTEENKDALMKQAIRDAIRISVAVDEAIVADSEVG
jgi:hypothetical protein